MHQRGLALSLSKGFAPVLILVIVVGIVAFGFFAFQKAKEHGPPSFPHD